LVVRGATSHQRPRQVSCIVRCLVADSMKKERWEELAMGIGCPFCAPRSDENDFWAKVASLAVSTLYLHKIQTYRGYSVLIFDPRHATRPSQLSAEEWRAWCRDLYLAQGAIEAVVHPQHMNVAALGNQIAHLHWHIIPRYEGDGRWGAPIWMTTEAEMEKVSLSPDKHDALVREIRAKII
jgi:diadenosine tetraphosphate (Ap4A) HIT family hydrolase